MINDKMDPRRIHPGFAKSSIKTVPSRIRTGRVATGMLPPTQAGPEHSVSEPGAIATGSLSPHSSQAGALGIRTGSHSDRVVVAALEPGRSTRLADAGLSLANNPVAMAPGSDT